MATTSRHFGNFFLERYIEPTSDAASVKTSFGKSAASLIGEVVLETWTRRGGRVRDSYVFTGSGGTAFLLLKAAFASNSKEDLSTALDIVEECAKVSAVMREHPSFLLGQPGIYALGVVTAFHAGQQGLLDTYLNLFKQSARLPGLATPSLQCNDTPPNELLYGRAGFLWAALFLNKQLGQVIIPPGMTDPVIAAIIADGRACARHTEWPLMYEWHSKRYLGGAHGVVGILHVRQTRALLTGLSE